MLILIFTFQTPSWADDIRDFQIEGMSIGDSLLDYVSKNEIKKYDDHNKEDKNSKYKYFSTGNPSFKVYEGFQATYKNNDPKYLINSLTGVILYIDNIEDCYKKKKEIVLELDVLFKNAIKNSDIFSHRADASGKSKVDMTEYEFKSGSTIAVDCFDWSEEFPRNDSLGVSIRTKEINDWISNEAYK